MKSSYVITVDGKVYTYPHEGAPLKAGDVIPLGAGLEVKVLSVENQPTVAGVAGEATAERFVRRR